MLIRQATAHKANLVIFPERYISTFPIWSSILLPTENYALFQHMVGESIYADSEEIYDIREAARIAAILVSIGSERWRHSNGHLLNCNLSVGTEGEVRVHHRKLVRTFFDKLARSPGDGFL